MSAMERKNGDILTDATAISPSPRGWRHMHIRFSAMHIQLVLPIRKNLGHWIDCYWHLFSIQRFIEHVARLAGQGWVLVSNWPDAGLQLLRQPWLETF
jgi:hypothetical protein